MVVEVRGRNRLVWVAYNNTVDLVTIGDDNLLVEFRAVVHDKFKIGEKDQKIAAADVTFILPRGKGTVPNNNAVKIGKDDVVPDEEITLGALLRYVFDDGDKAAIKKVDALVVEVGK